MFGLVLGKSLVGFGGRGLAGFGGFAFTDQRAVSDQAEGKHQEREATQEHTDRAAFAALPLAENEANSELKNTSIAMWIPQLMNLKFPMSAWPSS
jgi:hypothetical protein